MNQDQLNTLLITIADALYAATGTVTHEKLPEQDLTVTATPPANMPGPPVQPDPPAQPQVQQTLVPPPSGNGAAPEVSLDDLRATLTALANQIPLETRDAKLQELLAPYGATKLSLLAPSHYAAVQTAAQAMAAGIAS